MRTRWSRSRRARTRQMNELGPASHERVSHRQTRRHVPLLLRPPVRRPVDPQAAGLRQQLKGNPFKGFSAAIFAIATSNKGAPPRMQR